MKSRYLLRVCCAAAAMTGVVVSASAQNPVVRDQFAADPTARVFNGRVYLYPSHDIPAPEGQRQDWFCMEDYHVFSSDNLTDWTDHGVVITQNAVPWVRPDSYSMWAPDCVSKNGKYYLYFPSAPKGEGRGFAIGVAVADRPEGPFRCEEAPIRGVSGIDPCVLISSDGKPRRYRKASLSDSEIMTILIVFQFGSFRNFKHYYLFFIKEHLKSYFPKAVSYNRFVELQSRVFFLMMFFLNLSAFGRCTGISFVDSTMVPVCLIETINDMLKNTAQLVHSRHRSVNNFIMSMIAALAAYCFFDNKPQPLKGYCIENT